jgi:hypothetical protein
MLSFSGLILCLPALLLAIEADAVRLQHAHLPTPDTLPQHRNNLRSTMDLEATVAGQMSEEGRVEIDGGYATIDELLLLIAAGPSPFGTRVHAEGLPHVFKGPNDILSCLVSKRYVMFVGDSNSRLLVTDVLVKLLGEAIGPSGGKIRVKEVTPSRREACLLNPGESPCNWNWVHADREFFISEVSNDVNAAEQQLFRISFRFIHSEEDAINLFVNAGGKATKVLRDFDGSTDYIANHDAIIRIVPGPHERTNSTRNFSAKDWDQIVEQFPAEPSDLFFAQSLWFLTNGRLSTGCKSPDCSAVESIMASLARRGPSVYWSNWGNISFECEGVETINECTAACHRGFHRQSISYVDMLQLTSPFSSTECCSYQGFHYWPWAMVAWLQTLISRSCPTLSSSASLHE